MKRRTITLLAASLVLASASLFLAGCGGDDGPSTFEAPDPNFVFNASPAGAFARVERIGLPGILLGIQDPARKEEYNQDSPSDDVTLKYKPDFDFTFDIFHPSFDATLSSLMINDPTPFGPLRPVVPCTSPGTTPPASVPGDPDYESCWQNVSPILIPDTIKIFPALAPGFPNGRQLAISCSSRLAPPLSSFSTGTHSILDQLLAGNLLQLEQGQEVQRCYFGNLPLNPPLNDRPFTTDFPFLAAPH